MSPISFLFRIDKLEPPDTSAEPNSEGHWKPPERADECECIEGPLYRWKDGFVSEASLTHPASQQPLQLYDHTAIFTAFPDTLHFLAVGYDKQDPKKYHEAGWKELSFTHASTENPNHGLSILGIHLSEYHLMAPPSPNTFGWIRDLFNEQYRYHPQHHLQDGQPVRSAGLTGTLTLLLALVAFSCLPKDMDYVLKYSLALGRWIPHRRMNGSKASFLPLFHAIDRTRLTLLCFFSF